MTIDREWYASLPRKRSAAGVLLRDETGRVLLTKPTYKDHWQVAGGIVEDGESPRQAAIREVQEELGITVENLRLRVVDFMPDQEKGDSYQFIFDGGVLSDAVMYSIQCDETEIAEIAFFSREEAESIMSDNQKRRIANVWDTLDQDDVFYLESGRRVA